MSKVDVYPGWRDTLGKFSRLESLNVKRQIVLEMSVAEEPRQGLDGRFVKKDGSWGEVCVGIREEFYRGLPLSAFWMHTR
jgi:hypothetical protein